MLTRSPRSFSNLPMLDAVSPLPRLEATPPVTKRCLVVAGPDACADIANEAPVVRFGGLSHSPTGSQDIRRTEPDRADTTAACPHAAGFAQLAGGLHGKLPARQRSGM